MLPWLNAKMFASRSSKPASMPGTRCALSNKLPWVPCHNNSWAQTCFMEDHHQLLHFPRVLVDKCHSLEPFLDKVAEVLVSPEVCHLNKAAEVDQVVLNKFHLPCWASHQICLELSHQE